MNIRFIFFLSISFLLFSCSLPKTKEKESAFQEIYELSEMATIMENMYDFLNENRELIIEGRSTLDIPDYFIEIHTAEMTEGFQRDTLLENHTESFLWNINRLENGENSDRIALFNNTITSCIACHKSEVGCTGPIPRIEKLLIKP